MIQHHKTLYVSGQIPRIGDQIMVTGRAGFDVALADAQRAARICAMRALTVLAQALGGLDQVDQILRLTVYVQSTERFTALSEVADGASAVLHQVLQTAGAHSRTSVGVFQLPKNATVELDLMAAVL